MPRLSYLATAALALTSSGFAELTWDRTRAELAAAAGDAEVVALYRFKNEGTRSVTITHVRTSCQCTTAEPSVSLVKPGQEGVLRAVFDVADRRGQQEKTIEVLTDEPDAKPATLVLRVNVTEVVTAQPRAVVWHVGEDSSEKTITLEAINGFKLRKVVLPDDTGNFDCRITPLSSGGYELHIKPKSTSGVSNGIIRCIGTVDGRPPLGVIVYALVR